MSEYSDLIPKGKNQFQDLIPSNMYADLIPGKKAAFTSQEFPWFGETEVPTDKEIEEMAPKRRPEGIYAAPPETTMGKVGAFIGESVVPFSKQLRGEVDWRSPETAMEAGALAVMPKFFQAGAALAPRVINRFKPGYLMKKVVQEAHRIRPPIAPLPKIEPVTPVEVVPPVVELAPKPIMPERYMGEVRELRDLVFRGEPGKRIPVESELSTHEWGGYGSSYPPFMRNKGWTKDEVLTTIDKGLAGEKLGSKQAEIWQATKDEARGVFGEKVRIAQKEKIQPINTGELEPGDRIKVHGEVLKVTGKTPEEITIKDGQEYHLDPYFDQIEGKRIAPKGKVQEAPTPKIDVEEINLQTYPKSLGGGARIPKYAEGSSINLERLDTTDELKEFANGLTKSIEEKIGKKKITWGEVRQKAESLGWDEKAVSNAWAKKGSFSAAEIDAARQLNLNSISALHEKVKNLPGEVKTYSPELRAQVLDTLNLVRTTSQASSEAGRSLNVHKRVLQNDPSFKEASEINRALNALKGKGVKKTDDLINALRTIDFNDPAAVNQFIYSVTKTSFQKLSDTAYRLWIEGLLSNPPTHIANTVSNSLFFMYQYPERALGAGIERLRAGVMGKVPERYVGETGEALFSIGKGIKDGLSSFYRSMRTGEGFGKLEFRPSPIPKKIEPFTPTRALVAEDLFFKALVQNDELNRIAYRMAMKKGTQGELFQNKITELLKNPTEEMLEQAGERANYVTFNKDLGKIGQMALRLRDVELPPGSGVKPFGYFVPFIRTPANIAKVTLERTPLNIPRIAYKVAKGELKGGELSEELAKPIMGSFLAVGAYLMAKEGNLTGGLPKSKAERAEWERIGKLPYSIKVGDRYVSIARFEPLASILGVAADFSQIEDKALEGEKVNIGAAIAGSISKNITNKTFTLGFARLNDAISNPEQYAEQSIESLAGSIIPAAVGGAARAIDPEVREAKGIIDRVRSRIPGVSQGLPAQLNIWGEPIQREGGAAFRFIFPLQISKEKGTPIDHELYRLKINVGMPSRRIGKTDLTPDQYEEYVVMAGGPAKEELNKMIQKSWYDRLSDEDKSTEIRRVVENYRKDSREKLSRKYGIAAK